jgi:hypothetical protein
VAVIYRKLPDLKAKVDSLEKDIDSMKKLYAKPPVK